MVVNIKTIKVSLSEKELDDLINKIMSLQEGLKEADNKIVEEMAQLVEDEVSTNLRNTPVADGNDQTQPYSIINGNKAEAGMSGSQAVYNEFGTGIVGQRNSHNLSPTKFGLRNYNTGLKIDKETGVWWYYKDGFKKTTGIPAGKQVFDASMSLNNKKEEIIKKRVGEVISKL